ncbi:MAG: TetR/AcrR family transcriptional regulator [Actinomycetia bacterium]|nr:TetR/AcrR family transcriptional regulator [Actinomycetes bacterium]
MGAPQLSVRKRPVQERGRRRFDLILSSARSQLSEVGLDGFTLEAVAIGADVPIGSVYQFFPNKHALIAELSREDTVALASELHEAAQGFDTTEWQSGTDGVIDNLAELWRTDPTRRHVWLAMQSTAATRSLLADQTKVVTDEVVPLVEPLLPPGSKRRTRTIAEVVVQMCYSLLHFSVRDDRPHPSAVRELKRALRSYLRAVALDPSL